MTTTIETLPAIAAQADAAYAAAVEAHGRAEQAIVAASSYLDAVRVRERELQAQAASVGTEARILRRAMVDALVDRAAGPEDGSSRLAHLEQEHGLIVSAIEAMVLFRLRDSERSLLVCRRAEAEARAVMYECNLHVRRTAQVAALSLLAEHEGAMDLKTSATQAVQREILSARDDARRWQTEIDRHDIETARLRQGAL